MKKTNKKYILLAVAVVFLIIIASTLYLTFINNNNSNKNNEHEQTQETVEERVEVYDTNIESTESNHIESEQIEVKNIHIKSFGDELNIETTIKNNSTEALNGYYIEIELLDSKDNVITIIADNSEDIIPAGESKEIINFASGLENQDIITNARISTARRQTIDKYLEQSLNEDNANLEN